MSLEGRAVFANAWRVCVTAPTITALSCRGDTALWAWPGRRALGAVLDARVRRGLGWGVVGCGVALALI